jgi:hypothetical protein
MIRRSENFPEFSRDDSRFTRVDTSFFQEARIHMVGFLRQTSVSVAFAALMIGLLPGTSRGSMIFTANITSDQETPSLPSEGSSGTGTFVLNDAMTRLTYDVHLFGLDLDGNQTPANPNDNVTRAHFHAGAPGVAGGIVYGIIDASASLRNDNSPNDLVIDIPNGHITGAWDAGEGNGTTLTAQLSNLLSGNLYFNIHTSDHGTGEIRGQVLPEPATVALLAVALPTLMARRRFR